MNVIHTEQHFSPKYAEGASQAWLRYSLIVYSAAGIFMCEAQNSQLENAAYTRRLPEVGEPTNDPQRKDSVRKNDEDDDIQHQNSN